LWAITGQAAMFTSKSSKSEVPVQSLDASTTGLTPSQKTKAGYLRKHGLRDFIYLILVVIVGYLARHYLAFPLTDGMKWRARPTLSTGAPGLSRRFPGTDGMRPCLFIVPPTATNQPVVSGSIDDCVLLVPNGMRLDLFELDLSQSVFYPIKTDLYQPDIIPLAFTRTYHPIGDWETRFKISLPNVYNPFLYGSRMPYTYLVWTLPDQFEVPYRRVSPGTMYYDAIYEESLPLAGFGGSRINWNGDGWDISLDDGTTYLSPEAYYSTHPMQGSLVAIFDKAGNEVRLKRQPSGDLTEIRSPNGKWIRLDYDQSRVARARDNSGNSVNYSYGIADRLTNVAYSDGTTIRYIFDSANRITQVECPAGSPLLKNEYGNQGRVVRLQLADGRAYSFQYGTNTDSNYRWIEATDPQSNVIRVNEEDTGYSVQKLPPKKSN
jgi:YD repeat-containing protein